MAQKKKIVILGAGYAGIQVAKKLEKKAKKAKVLDQVEITIIDKNPYHTMLTELHEVAAWRVDEEGVRLDIKKIFAGRQVNVVQDKIVNIDYDNNRLTGEDGTYDYDHFVMASGVTTNYWGVPGAKEHTFPLWSFEEAANLRDHIMQMFRLASIERDVERKKELLTFFVVGAGFTGVEMAGELAELAPTLCDRFYIDPELVNVILIDMLAEPMPMLPKKAINRSIKRMEKMGITQIYNASVKEVTEGGLHYELDGQKHFVKSETVVWSAGTQGSDIAQKAEELGHKGRAQIATDGQLRSLEHPNVYVSGDNLFYIPPGEEKPVPQMVENCKLSAAVVATNLLAEIKGQEPTEIYQPKFGGTMVCIGGRYGTAHLRLLPNTWFVLPSFFAMLMKHLINIIYFFSVSGWNKVYAYIKAQFFTIRDDRSILGGHFSNKAPTFWTVPLRLITGLYFIYLGYVRTTFGWLQNPALRDIFYNVAAEFRPPAPGPMTNINIFNYLRFSVHIVDNSMLVWFRTVPMDWFLQTFVVSSDGAQMFWQWVIVLFYILVGLAILGGLFTKFASVGVLLWSFVVFATVGLSIHQFWIPVAGLACFAAGRVFSLDYYVGPWLKKRWKKIPFVKKWYLFHD